MTNRLLIDGHVHVHDCYDEATFLSAAYENLSQLGNGTPTLLLAEMAGANVFGRWRSGNSAWPVTVTKELSSLILGGKLLVVAGRQIVTSERIEVLALLCYKRFEDGRPLLETITHIAEAGGITVLPWGVGKWSGPRGRLVATASKRHRLLLGDNAGRPKGWPAPAAFGNHVVLPGTDPLRLKSQQRIVGTYGFVLTGTFDLQRPAEAIANTIRCMTHSPRTVGHRVGLLEFLGQQVGIRLTKSQLCRRH